MSGTHTGGDIDLVTGANKAWLDFSNWPPAMRELSASFHTTDIAQFVTKAVRVGTTRKYFSDQGVAQTVRSDSKPHVPFTDVPTWMSLRLVLVQILHKH
jgi:hypothetical protein